MWKLVSGKRKSVILVSRIRALEVVIKSCIYKEKKKWFVSLSLEMGHGVLD